VKLKISVDMYYIQNSPTCGGVVVEQSCLTDQLARAADDVTDYVAAALAAFETEETPKYREEAVLSCSSTTEAVSFPVLVGFLLLAVDGGPHGIHLH